MLPALFSGLLHETLGSSVVTPMHASNIPPEYALDPILEPLRREDIDFEVPSLHE